MNDGNLAPKYAHWGSYKTAKGTPTTVILSTCPQNLWVTDANENKYPVGKRVKWIKVKYSNLEYF